MNSLSLPVNLVIQSPFLFNFLRLKYSCKIKCGNLFNVYLNFSFYVCI